METFLDPKIFDLLMKQNLQSTYELCYFTKETGKD